MNLARLESRMCFALVFTAIVAHCIAQHALLLVLVSGMLAVGSRYVCEGPRGLTLPRPVSLLLTAIVMVITAINIIAGLIIGVAQREMPLSAAATNYTVLTIGDGLVSQMPALLISVAAGVVVARAGSKGVISEELTAQLFNNAQKLKVVSVVVAGMAVIPGMPTLPFLVLGAGLFYLGQRASTKEMLRHRPSPASRSQWKCWCQ